MPAALPKLLLFLADGDGHMDWDGGWWIVMVLGMALFWGLVILAVVWIVRELGRSGSRRTTDVAPDALAVLDRRFAAGEISTDEYEERRAALRGQIPPAR